MIDFGHYDVILEMDERENDMLIHVRIGRFDCVPGSGPPKGFHMEVTRTCVGGEPEKFESGFFRMDDVWDLPLYATEEINDRIRAAILERCFGIVAYAWYQIQTEDAKDGVPVLMSVVREGKGYVLSLGVDAAAVEFQTLEELRAMLPPFGAEHERNYENARKIILERFGERHR